MSAYQYKALQKDGKKKTGIIEASGPKEARSRLRSQGLTPLEITDLKRDGPSPSLLSRFDIRHRIRPSDIALLTRQLATLADAGSPIEECLRAITDQSEKNSVKQLLTAVRQGVMEGHSLAEALGAFPNAFSELYCATVGAGEQTGQLALVLNRLADHTEQQMEMKSKMMHALIYPLLMSVISIAIVMFLLIFVVPKIVNVFTSTGQVLPLATRMLLQVSAFLHDFGWFVLLFVIISIAAIRYAWKTPSTRKKIYAGLLRFPPTAYFQKTVNTARFARTFAILNAAGVEVLQAMRVSATLVSNLVMREGILEASYKVREGTSIHSALKQTDYFSPMTLHLIASGENSGRLADMLERAAKTQEIQVSRLIALGLTLFEPMIILVMGAVVLFIVLAILLPIFQMDQLIG